jgi:hypothetical protein
MCFLCPSPLGENYLTVGTRHFHHSCWFYWCERVTDNREKEISNERIIVADTNRAAICG